MGDKTAIEWTRYTWNPFQGCYKISDGCKNCYMYAEKKRYGQNPRAIVRSKNGTFDRPYVWNKQVGPDAPLQDRLVFTASWSDWGLPEVNEFRPDAWKVIRECPNLIFQVLTKRADRLKDILPDDWGDGYPNVWLGVTVENPDNVDRIRYLLDVPARLRFLSLEPLLGEIPEIPGLHCGSCLDRKVHWCSDPVIDWVIVGGESGPNARLCHLDWVRSIVDQCRAASVPVFVKQLGAFVAVRHPMDPESDLRVFFADRKAKDPDEWPLSVRVREFPKF